MSADFSLPIVSELAAAIVVGVEKKRGESDGLGHKNVSGKGISVSGNGKNKTRDVTSLLCRM